MGCASSIESARVKYAAHTTLFKRVSSLPLPTVEILADASTAVSKILTFLVQVEVCLQAVGTALGDKNSPITDETEKAELFVAGRALVRHAAPFSLNFFLCTVVACTDPETPLCRCQ